MKTHTIDTAAQLLATDPSTVRALIEDGHLPAAKIGRAWVMRETDLEDYLADRIREQTAERIERRTNGERFKAKSEASRTTRYQKRVLPDLAKYEAAA